MVLAILAQTRTSWREGVVVEAWVWAQEERKAYLKGFYRDGADGHLFRQGSHLGAPLLFFSIFYFPQPFLWCAARVLLHFDLAERRGARRGDSGNYWLQCSLIYV